MLGFPGTRIRKPRPTATGARTHPTWSAYTAGRSVSRPCGKTVTPVLGFVETEESLLQEIESTFCMPCRQGDVQIKISIKFLCNFLVHYRRHFLRWIFRRSTQSIRESLRGFHRKIWGEILVKEEISMFLVFVSFSFVCFFFYKKVLGVKGIRICCKKKMNE